jgi:hypothetical protein
VLDQEDAPFAVDHQGAYTQRHGAGEAPVEVERAPQRRLERASGPLEREPFNAGVVTPRAAMTSIAPGLSKAWFYCLE